MIRAAQTSARTAPGVVMRFGLAFIVVTAFVMAASASRAATLIPVVPVSGSTQTTVFGINDSNMIAGGWFDSGGVEHGFIGTLLGSYATFDYTGAGVSGTEARGIWNDGSLTGWAPSTDTESGYEFFRRPNGTLVTITKGSGAGAVTLDGIAQGMTAGEKFVGNTILPPSYRDFAYIGKSGKWQENIALPAQFKIPEARGINKQGVIVGTFTANPDTDPVNHGFILSGGVATQVDYPNTACTNNVLESINDSGIATGQCTLRGKQVGYIFNTADNTFTEIRIPGSDFSQAWGINSAGLIAVNGQTGSFIYCPEPRTQCPSSGIAVPDGPSLHMPAGYFARYAVARATPDSPTK